ncbi:hypothetical protein F5I97DRAFT_1939324 [Phlebopus sp. FC_14]|nr:hypothetical protein F5I97DRAFT_1939324 [Phlebopus sp. FC_14]
MGTSRKHQRHAKNLLPTRTRTTRSKGKPLADPELNTQLLTEQLRSLGLYAAHTVGDGNCLFRALSDQLYGSPSQHLQLRKDICDWIESYSQRYEPFCEDERGLTAHLRCMREQGAPTAGHLELSAFAHFSRRNVKVIQPGLVYVIEWTAGGGGDILADQSSARAEEVTDQREKRRLRKHHLREDPSCEEEAGNTVYVAYHDWEHFSSIRNLRGPHTGPPHVHELPAGSEPVTSSPVRKKPPSQARVKPELKTTLKRSKNGQFASVDVKIEEPTPPTPAQVPLPLSRSPSPLSSSESLDLIDVDPPPPAPIALSPADAPSSTFVPRTNRSPKRSFDESSGSSLSDPVETTETDDRELSPDLSTPRSSTDSTQSSSRASSPLPSTPPPEPQKPLTRRQRKLLGLPKPRAALVQKRAGAGTIIIPGGRFKKEGAKTTVSIRLPGDDNADDDGSVQDEWQRNGTGRLDVRGFRELRI